MTTLNSTDPVVGLPEISEEDFARLVRNFAKNFKTFKDLWGITSEELEAVYTIAYQSYASGGYEQAHKIFRFLCFYDHLNFKFWLGLGCCRQVLGQYAEAVEAYTLAMLLDCDDPRPPLHAAECHLALGNRDAALSGLTAAREWAGDRPEHQGALSRALELMQQIPVGASPEPAAHGQP